MSFEGFPLERSVEQRALRAGLVLDADAVAAISLHARAVIASNARLHLTSIVDAAMFVERHIGESLDGAAILDPSIDGTLVDLGSGNGYPGIPLAIARPLLRPRLLESSRKKAAFLREVVTSLRWPESTVVERAVRTGRDLDDLAPVSVLATRAMGGWERLLPKLAPAVSPRGLVLLWAGAEAEGVLRRVAWRRYAVRRRERLADRERSCIWLLTTT